MESRTPAVRPHLMSNTRSTGESVTDEEFYDSEVAPVLMDLAKKHQERGLAFFALSQWGAEEAARTVTLPENPMAVFRYLNVLAQAAVGSGVNIDSFMLAVMREAREKGHSSMVLKQLGVEPR